jgi:hypothetical protein
MFMNFTLSGQTILRRRKSLIRVANARPMLQLVHLAPTASERRRWSRLAPISTLIIRMNTLKKQGAIPAS